MFSTRSKTGGIIIDSIIDVDRLSLEALEALKASGWYEGRKISDGLLDIWLTGLVHEGFVVSVEFVKLISTLGNLRLKPFISANRAYMPSELHFDVFEAMDYVGDSAEYKNILSIRLQPIAVADQMVALFLDHDNRLLLDGLGSLYLMGDDITLGLDLLLTAKQRPVVLTGKPFWE